MRLHNDNYGSKLLRSDMTVDGRKRRFCSTESSKCTVCFICHLASKADAGLACREYSRYWWRISLAEHAEASMRAVSFFDPEPDLNKSRIELCFYFDSSRRFVNLCRSGWDGEGQFWGGGGIRAGGGGPNCFFCHAAMPSAEGKASEYPSCGY
jgi:hypothetical protein